jgi:hypothetical protein
MRAFNEIPLSQATDQKKEQIKGEITRQTKDYILGVDEPAYKEYLREKYAWEPLEVDLQNEQVGEPLKRKESRESRLHDEKYMVEVYYFTVSLNFTGSAEVFKLHTNPWAMTSYDIAVNEGKGVVSFEFGIDKQDAEEFKRRKAEAKNSAFANLENAKKNVAAWNQELPGFIENTFKSHKASLLKENDFFAAINLQVNKGAESLVSVPVIRKKIIPQPAVNAKQTFSTVPSVSEAQYQDLIKLLFDIGRGMERKPSLYKGKDENGIRDYFLSHLEFRYEGITASGETFNSEGKTDICLKNAPDGTNLFIAECKFWTGHAGFLDTITQLFDRYLTWRDSKVAVMMFVTNNDFTAVLNNIRTEIRNHPYYLRPNGQHGDSSFSYIFCLKQDRAKEVELEVMAFHFHRG